jgi:hypothetical protein
MLLLACAAEAARLPVYRDPPSYTGRTKAPATKPAPAPALPPAVVLSDTGLGPQVVVDEAGTAHIVWNEGRGDQDDAAVYCRLKRGASGCDQRVELTWPKSYGPGDSPQFNTDNDGPAIVRAGNQLVVLSKRYPTSSGAPDGISSSSNTIAWTSSDGGQSWSGAQQVGHLNVSQLVALASGDTTTIINSAVDPFCHANGAAGWCLEVYRAGQFGTQANLSTRSDDNYYPGIALDETGRPIAIAENLDGTTEIRRWTGNGDVGDPAQWTTSSAKADQPAITGGPAGAFLMSKAEYNRGPFDVRRLNVGADGVVTPGPPFTLGKENAQFAAIAQDPSGRLHAAWQRSTFEGQGGVFMASSTGAGFAPEQRLSDGTGNGQITLGAAADGGGFVVYNHTGGVVGDGQIVAQGFGNQAATGQPGLGDIPGGAGSNANVTCQKVGFGKFDVETAQGCLLQGQGSAANLVVSTGEITLNGLRIIPDAGVKITIDPKLLRIDTTGGVKVVVSNPLVGDVVLFHGVIHRDLSRLVPGSTLFEFASQAYKANILGFDVAANIPVKLAADGVLIPVDLELPAFGAFTGHADLVANKSGLQVNSLRLHAGPIPLGALVINTIDVNYAAGEWNGAGKLTVPAGGTVNGSFRFKDGDFLGARFAYTPQPPITIGPFVYLLTIGGGFDVKPSIKVEAFARVGAGAAVGGQAPVSVDGRFTMKFPAVGPAEFLLTGQGNIFMFGIAKGFVQFQTDGYAAFGGEAGVDLEALKVNATANGFVDAGNGQWGANLKGKVEICLPVIGCSGPETQLALSPRGFKVCGKLPVVGSAGVEFPWSVFTDDPALLANPLVLTYEIVKHRQFPCDATGYAPQPPRPVGARAASTSQVVTLPRGLPGASFLIEGDGGAPQVTVRGPGGATGTAVSEGPFTTVILQKPAAGDWAITTNPGSPEIKTVSVSQGFTPASASATVKRGRIAYRIAHLGNGQSVTFAERGRFGTHVLGHVAKARGTLRFRPAAGAGGKRSVIAMVEHDGIVTHQRVVGSYVAPGPAKAGAVGRLRAKHKGTTLSVSWRKAANASRYVVDVRGSKGTHVARMLGAKARGLTLRAMRRDERFKVSVRAFTNTNRAGSTRAAKTR